MILHKTKIVCTIGPSSDTSTKLEEMIKAGINVARLNFSHGTYKDKKETLKLITNLENKLNTTITTLADLQGPKLRIGAIDGTRLIKKSENLKFSASPKSDEIPLQLDLSPYLAKNHRVFLNDGLVELLVEKVSGKTIFAKAKNEGYISSNKGINVPDTLLDGKTLTKKDIQDLGFAIEQKFDYVALSFVQSAKDIKRVREILKNANSNCLILAKIESAKAVENLEKIIEAADAVMVARGDLAIETAPSQVPIIQQNITTLARQYKKPIIIATHMLRSMIENPRATRAEVSDVANAVMNQVDAVMLSAESATGKYPTEAVRVMHDIIKSVEENPDFKHYYKIDWTSIPQKEMAYNALTSSAASIAYRLKCKFVVVATATGRNARIISSFRPDAHIIAVTHDNSISKKLNLIWGVKAISVKPQENSDLYWAKIISEIKKSDLAPRGEKIVMVGGSKVGISGATDTIKVATI